ncbi:MAG: symporter-like protein [Rhodoblastus sp.]|nr:symporter-like protein [Rhodoblastus sp.]
MHRPATEDEARARDAIDGRVTFAIVAFVATGGLIVLLDRVGVSERFIAAIGPTMALLALGLIGFVLRTMRISGFYAASRAAPPAYAGFATAAIATALVAPFTPPVSDLYSGAGVFTGFALGLACVAFVSGPYLRRTGAFSISDLVGARFENMALRLGAALLVGVSALLAGMAGFETAVSALSTIASLSRGVAAVAVAAVLVVAAVPGGLSGVLWAAVAAAGVALAGFTLPLALAAIAGQAIPLPVLGDQEAWRKATSLISFWQGDSGQPVSLWLSLGMALGMAASAPLIAPFLTVRDRTAALRAGIGAGLWSAALAALVAATVAASALGLIDQLGGRRPDRIPDQIYAASAARLIKICDQYPRNWGQARDACQKAPGFTGAIRPQDISTRGAFLLTALPPLGGFGAAATGFVWAAVAALGGALAAAGLLAAAVALGNDAIHRLRDKSALTSRRLAIVRAILLASILACALVCSARELDSRALIGVSLAFSAAGLAPLMALTLWPRARSRDAMFALVIGLGTAETMLIYGEGTVRGLAAAAVVGCFASVIAGVLSSQIGGGDRSAGYRFVAAVWRPEGDVVAPDKGA